MLFLANCLPCVSIWWYCNSVTYVCLGFIMKEFSLVLHVFCMLMLFWEMEQSCCTWKKYVPTPVGGHLGELLVSQWMLMLIKGFVLTGSKNLIGRTQLMFNNLWCNILHVHIYSYSTLCSKSDWLHNDVLSCASWVQHCSEMSRWTWTRQNVCDSMSLFPLCRHSCHYYSIQCWYWLASKPIRIHALHSQNTLI